MKEEPTSLDTLTRSVLGRRQELTAQVTEFLVGKRHAQALEQKSAPCPQCGRLLPARGLVLQPRIFDNFKKRYNSGILLPGVRCEVCLLGNTGFRSECVDESYFPQVLRGSLTCLKTWFNIKRPEPLMLTACASRC